MKEMYRIKNGNAVLIFRFEFRIVNFRQNMDEEEKFNEIVVLSTMIWHIKYFEYELNFIFA